MADQGYIKLHRSLLDWEWWSDMNTTRLFMYLLIAANFKPKKWQGMTIKRGQLVTSVASLSAATGLTTKQVRVALDHLKTTREVTIKTTNKYTLVTVENYSKFQDVPDENGKQNGKQQGNRTANKGQQLKNVKNDKNKECVCIRQNTQPYGVLNNVYLTPEEYAALNQYENSSKLIDKLSLWLEDHQASNHYSKALQFALNDNWPKRTQPIVECSGPTYFTDDDGYTYCVTADGIEVVKRPGRS